MKTALALAAALAATPAMAQAPNAAVLSHMAAAKTAAGLDWGGIASLTCLPDAPAAPRSVRAPAPARTIPPRSEWYAKPQKVFDNLYWVGTRIHSAWVLKTSQGMILIDTLYNYAVEPEIVQGLKTLGLDPAQVKYVIVSHGHGDHDEGAALFQSRYGSHVVMGAPDWDAVEKMTAKPGGAPKRDIVATDGQKLTLGDTTVSIYLTPGHTLGTLGLTFPVKDRGRTLTAAYSGGTAFNFRHEPGRFDTYIASQGRMEQIAASAGATVLLSNHSVFDNALDRARVATLPRQVGEPHPMEVGAKSTVAYFTVLKECAIAIRTLEFGS